MNGRRVPSAWSILGIVAGIASVASTTYFIKSLKSVLSKKSTGGRYRAYYLLAFEWLMKKNEEGSFSERLKRYFNKNGINTIAIYGSGTMGEVFYNEIKDTGVKVSYFIDRNTKDIYEKIGNVPSVVLSGIKNQADVDAVIVTPIFDFNEISEDLADAGYNLNLISLADIIRSI